MQANNLSLLKYIKQSTGLVQQNIDAVRNRHVKVNNQWIVSFICASYLGLEKHHAVRQALFNATREFGISLAMPRVLASDRISLRLEQALAKFAGCSHSLIFPSTTHVSIDVLPLLAGPDGIIFTDSLAYPTSEPGVCLARKNGARISVFPHNDVNYLKRKLESSHEEAVKLIVCDGLYGTGSSIVKLKDFNQLARQYDAYLYIDDSHGLGILGRRDSDTTPYGSCGGGVARWSGINNDRLIVVGTLGKALGIPLAFAAGPGMIIKRLKGTANSLVHSNPPAIPMVAAALQALRIQNIEGDQRRQHIARLVKRFREGISRLGYICGNNSILPIQNIFFNTSNTAIATGRLLRQMGIWPALQLNPPDFPHGAVLRFYITALHSKADIDKAVHALSTARFRKQKENYL